MDLECQVTALPLNPFVLLLLQACIQMFRCTLQPDSYALLGPLDLPHEFTTTENDQKVCSNTNDDLLVGRDGALSRDPGNVLDSWFG